jgi:group I intron endonuclease
MFTIYKAENKINEKLYIGQTSNSLNYRKYKHHSKKGCVSLIYLAIKKYGKENFDWDTIAICDTKDKANFLEKFYIKFFNTKSPNGYNITEGGEGTPGLIAWNKGIPSPLKGIKRPDISEVMKKRKGEKRPFWSSEMKEKISGENNSHFGKPGYWLGKKNLVQIEKITGKKNPAIGFSRKGKTYEEIYGIEKGQELRKLRRESRNQKSLGN